MLAKIDPTRPDGVKLTPQQEKSRRARNIAIGVTVGLLALLFYAVTIVKFVVPGIHGGPM
jgi:hypothetical protein